MGRQADERFAQCLASSGFTKEGQDRLNRLDYQYESIGLGGTTMRPGPHGFTLPGAPALGGDGALDNRPFLIHEYWWDEDGHRVSPFDLVGGYGDGDDPGAITSFRHSLDIRTGLLTIELGLAVGGSAFESSRELFVTPDGVLVVRVRDSAEAPSPFRLRVQPRPVWPNGFFGIVCPPYEAVRGELLPEGGPKGLLLTAERPAACTALLAIAVETADPAVDAARCVAGPSGADDAVVYFIAPGSSYQGGDPVGSARGKATEAASVGWDGLLARTATWWADYYARSAVSVPDDAIMRWYARSLYYHGVYFGETDIPPGCFSTNPAGFLGTVCPEFDLVFSQFALLYTHRFAEARGVADWIAAALPQARRNAVESTLHKTTVRRQGGAFYGPLMGWDGRLFVPPTEGEGIHLYEKYPNANVSAMALAYVDWTGDTSFGDAARQILRDTTQVAAEDLELDPGSGTYRDRYSPGGLNAESTEFLIRESIKRGVSHPDWADKLDRLARNAGTYNGRPTIVAGNHRQNSGDAPWLQPLWWFGNVSGDDPRVAATYDFIRHSGTGRYVFNNGWMAVHASKLRRGDDAHRWVQNLADPGPGVPNPIFDDTNFGEIIHDREDGAKTPEIGAHGALICAVVQMLLDADDEDAITVLPSIPTAWETKELCFRGVVGRGCVSVSAAYAPGRVEVLLKNNGTADVVRLLRARAPKGDVRIVSPETGAKYADGWIEVPITLAPGESWRLLSES